MEIVIVLPKTGLEELEEIAPELEEQEEMAEAIGATRASKYKAKYCPCKKGEKYKEEY